MLVLKRYIDRLFKTKKMKSSKKISVETSSFNWDIPNNFTVNTKFKTAEKTKVYCHESYALELYNLMTGNMSGIRTSKDLSAGGSYSCVISASDSTHALAQTDSGQTIYIDLKKESKDAARLGLMDAINFEVGSEIKAAVRQISGTYFGSVVDCYIQNLKAEFFDQIKKQTMAYEARVKSINKGGYLVDVNGIECFLPGSLAAANKITDFDSYIGKKFYVMIDGYVAAKDIFVVSYKKYLHKIMDHKIQELDMTKKYKGHVTGTSAFGVFVEWEEIFTGLIHKTEFENQVIEGFNPGDEIEFYIKEIKEDNRLTLTFGEPLEKNKWMYELKKSVEDGTSEPMNAIVKHKRKNGALIEIGDSGQLALVPQEKLGKNSKNLQAGDTIRVQIYQVDPLAGKIFASQV